jgi:hypothetical protein
MLNAISQTRRQIHKLSLVCRSKTQREMDMHTNGGYVGRREGKGNKLQTRMKRF